jgi:F-box and leucine-rich repeat protein 2/20
MVFLSRMANDARENSSEHVYQIRGVTVECPSFLPETMKYCEACTSEADLIDAVSKHLSDLTTFFEAACDDEGWGIQHPHLLSMMLRRITRLMALNKLPLIYAEKVARVIQRHESLLEPHLLSRSVLFYNVNIIIEKESHWINSLMFAVASEFFRDQIRNLCWETFQNRLSLPGATKAYFPLIKEYLYTGIVNELWKAEFKDVHAIMCQAYRWGLQGLVWQCVDVLRRYLEKDNVIEHLLQAHRDHFPEWKHACYQFFNKQEWGLRFLEKGPDQLAVEFLDFRNETIELFNIFAPLITHIAFRGDLKERLLFNTIMNKCPNLIGLDLSEFRDFSTYLTDLPANVFDLIPGINFEGILNEVAMSNLPAYVADFLPNGILELDLSSCDWLKPIYLKFIFMFCPQLKKLSLQGNVQLTYETWGNFHRLPGLLSLDLSHCKQLTNEDLLTIIEACKTLENIALEDCSNLTDRGFTSILDHCLLLSHLNLNRTATTNKTLIDLSNRACELTHLSIQGSEEITEKGIAALARGCPLLKFLDVQGCQFISEKTVAKLQRARPSIRVIL